MFKVTEQGSAKLGELRCLVLVCGRGHSIHLTTGLAPTNQNRDTSHSPGAGPGEALLGQGFPFRCWVRRPEGPSAVPSPAVKASHSQLDLILISQYWEQNADSRTDTVSPGLPVKNMRAGQKGS